MKLLAIDPGERVGWCTVEYTTDSRDPENFHIATHGITELKPFALKLYESIGNYDVVVYETYRLFTGERGKAQAGSDLPTAQLVGMIRLLAWQAGVKLVGQSPSIKNTADKAAANHGVVAGYIAGESGVHDDAHDIDAIRHAYYYWWKKLMKEATSGQ
jgi:hypothetical protein